MSASETQDQLTQDYYSDLRGKLVDWPLYVDALRPLVTNTSLPRDGRFAGILEELLKLIL